MNGIQADYVIIGGVISILSLMFKLSRDTRIEQDKKIGRMYNRLDEVKEKQDARYVRKDVCEILHKQVANDLTEIKKDVKYLVKNDRKKR